MFFTAEMVYSQTAVNGDYRSAGTGNWNVLTTWQVKTAGSWATATSLPTSSSNVFIQSGHTITLDATGAADGVCKNLNINNSGTTAGTFGSLSITNASYSVKVYGKIRSWSGAAVTTTGVGDFTDANTTTLNATNVITSTTTGILKFVGVSRALTVSGEWANSNVSCNVEFALDAGATDTLNTSIKFASIVFSSGTVNAFSNAITVGTSSTCLTIKSGAKVISARSSAYVFANSTSLRCGTVTIDAGGTLELTGATPYLDCSSFVCNGTVLYSANANQNLLQPTPTLAVLGVTISQYANLTLSGTGTITKTATTNTTVTGTLTVSSNTTTFDLLSYVLDGGASNTITISNSGTIKTANTASVTPLPTGKTWGGLVQYSSAAGFQTIVSGSYNNLTLSNSLASSYNTLTGTINISGAYTPGTSTTANVVTGSTVNFNNATGGQTVTATWYNNLTISNTSGNTILASSGTIKVAGTFSPSASSTYTITTSTIDFNNASGGQTIPAFTYNNLTISNTSGNTTLASSGTIKVAGTFSPSASSTYTITGSTIDFNNSSGGQTIPAFAYHNLTISNTSGNTTLASSGIIKIAGTFSPSTSSTYTISGSTVDFNGSIGGQTVPKFNFNNLTVSVTASYTTSVVADTIGVAGTFTPGSGNFTVPIGNTFNFNTTATSPGQTIPAFNYYNILFKNINATTYNTLAADINVKNSLCLAGKKGLTPGLYKVVYEPGATFFFSGVATDTIYNTSPQWQELNGPTNVTLNNTVSATLVYDWKASPTDTFRIVNVSAVSTGTGTALGTVTTSTNHTLQPNDIITIGGLSNSELGSFFGGSFTVQTPITSNTFTIAINYDTTMGASVVGGVAKKRIERTIAGTLSLYNLGKISVNFGNTLRFANGATIFRNDSTATIYNNNGFLAMGSVSTDRVNVTIGNTMVSDNEFSFFATPGKYGRLKIQNPSSGGISIYTTAGSRTIVDIENYGVLRLPQTTSSNLYVYGSLSGTGTISSYDSATIRFIGSNIGSAGKLNFTPGYQKVYSLLMNRTVGSSVYLGSPVTIKQILDLSSGRIIDSGNVITVNGSITGTSSGAHISTGTGKIIMDAINSSTHCIKVGAFSLGNLEIAAGTGTVYDSTSFTVVNDLTLTSGNYVASPNTTYITTVQGNLLGSGTASGPGKIKMTGTSKIITGVTVDSIEIAQYSYIKAAANFTINQGLLLNGNLFDSTFTISNAGIIAGINSAIHTGSGRIKMTGSGKSILGNPSLMNIEIGSPSASVTDGFSAFINGTLFMNGGNVSVNSGNTLYFRNNSSIIRTSGELNSFGSGNVFMGIASTDVVNVFINENLQSTGELPGSHVGKIDLTINDGFSYTLKSSSKLVRNLNVSGGHLITLFDTLTKAPYNLTVTNQATISGDFYIDSTTYNYLGTFKVGPTLTISSTGKLKFGNVNNKKLYANGLLTLESRKTGTASVADITNGGNNSGNDILGTVTVERFVSNIKNLTMDTGRTVKAWRLLATPTKHNFQTIKQAWQEGGSLNSNPKPGFGTQLTSNRSTWSADGFDMFSAGGPSIKYYNPVDSSWIGVTSTNEPFVAGRAYMVFIRGSRAKTSFTDIPDSTVLREKGSLNTGEIVTTVGTGGNQFVSVANPYPSAINYQALTKSNISSFVWLYDPRLGSYGGYQTVAPDGTAVPGGGSYVTGNTYIQSSQGFFVRTTSAAGSITFKETSKIDGSNITSRESSILSTFRTGLYKVQNGSVDLTDGVLHIIDETNNNDLDEMDAMKFSNFGENIGIKISNKLLSIESRKPFTELDTIFYQLGQLKIASYQLQFSFSNIQLNNLQPYLEDNFLHTSTGLSSAGITTYDFSVTSVVGSYASDRFRIVFKQDLLLPVSFIDVNALPKVDNIVVNWKVAKQLNILSYSIEKSLDGLHFSGIGNKSSTTNASIASYSFEDSNAVVGTNYYRIKSVGASNEMQYSKIVKVVFEKSNASIVISPNPIETGKEIRINTNAIPFGNYLVVLYDFSGKKIISKSYQQSDSNQEMIWKLPVALPIGQYRICFINESTKICESLLVRP